ncbi:MAG: hypothetical protein HKN59_06755 [Gammaproteobacteria bacterium]|nr:hypothetical protein [Gammaproteobacteria bacterium]
MKTVVALLKREVWENPAFYVAPLVVAALILLSGIYNAFYVVSKYVGYERVVTLLGTIPEAARPVIYSWWPLLLIVFNLVMVAVIAFYLMDSLYADRKDRSILFWKSLPVPDSTTVLSKLVTALVTVPAITVAVTVGSALVLMIMATLIIWFGGGSAWALLWKPVPLIDGTLFVAYAFLVQSLWYVPLVGWVMLASAWARRAPFMWTVLPPIGLVLLEQMLLRTERFAELLGERIVGVIPLAFQVDDDKWEVMWEGFQSGDAENVGRVTDVIDPTPLLTSPQLWTGFVVGALFVAAAIWLRRYRDET